MDYTYDMVQHQVGREQVDPQGNGEDKIVETFYSHAVGTQLVIRCDAEGTFFTINSIDNRKMMGSARTKQYTIEEVLP